MNKFRCKLGFHAWKYHNSITRQCLDCGKIQYKSAWWKPWQDIGDSYFQKGAKVELQQDIRTITVRKGTIVMIPDGYQILNAGTRTFKFVACKVTEDIVIDIDEMEREHEEIRSMG